MMNLVALGSPSEFTQDDTPARNIVVVFFCLLELLEASLLLHSSWKGRKYNFSLQHRSGRLHTKLKNFAALVTHCCAAKHDIDMNALLSLKSSMLTTHAVSVFVCYSLVLLPYLYCFVSLYASSYNVLDSPTFTVHTETIPYGENYEMIPGYDPAYTQTETETETETSSNHVVLCGGESNGLKQMRTVFELNSMSFNMSVSESDLYWFEDSTNCNSQQYVTMPNTRTMYFLDFKSYLWTKYEFANDKYHLDTSVEQPTIVNTNDKWYDACVCSDSEDAIFSITSSIEADCALRVYSVSEDAWTAENSTSSLNVARREAMCAYSNTRRMLFVFGGHSNQGVHVVFNSTEHTYIGGSDPYNNGWVVDDTISLSYARFEGVAVTLYDASVNHNVEYIYIIGGYEGTSRSFYTRVDVLNVATWTMTTAEINTGVRKAAATITGAMGSPSKRIWIFGGHSSEGIVDVLQYSEELLIPWASTSHPTSFVYIYMCIYKSLCIFILFCFVCVFLRLANTLPVAFTIDTEPHT